ncbi:MAG: APC family permease [Firmicutes bacterium]|nr:APC family permease [Bacillota bacterium]
MSAPPVEKLVRAMGRWTLVALVINSIIGSGIFGLPSEVIRMVGSASPFFYLLAAAGIGVIMACFAEVASQFRDAGGPYLYARAAFGPLLGLQTAWLAWLVRLTSAAANANLFVIYLTEFWAGAGQPGPRVAVLTALLGFWMGVNLRGVRSAARVSNIFTVAKLLPLAVFVGVGLFFLRGETPVGLQLPAEANWPRALLALVFAYGGFEAALLPMGEARQPERDAPFALFTALAVVTLLYVLIQLVVMGTLPDPTATNRPLAAAANQFLGPAGGMLIALGAMVSVFGYLGGQFVSAPRLTYALAEQGDFPAFFGQVHPRYRTPHVSILVYTLLVWALAIYGSFLWNAVLSAVARLFTYGLGCAALLVFRRRQPDRIFFRLPAAPLWVGLALGFCTVLLLRMGRGELLAVSLTAAVAWLNWLWARHQIRDPRNP